MTKEYLQSLFGETSLASIPSEIKPNIPLPKLEPGQKGNETITKILLIGGLIIITAVIVYAIKENRKEKEKKEFKFKD